MLRTITRLLLIWQEGRITKLQQTMVLLACLRLFVYGNYVANLQYIALFLMKGWQLSERYLACNFQLPY